MKDKVLDWSLSYMSDFKLNDLRKMLRVMICWCSRSGLDKMLLLETIVEDIAFETILPIRILELLLFLVG